jgi:hypothetical protein
VVATVDAILHGNFEVLADEPHAPSSPPLGHDARWVGHYRGMKLTLPLAEWRGGQRRRSIFGAMSPEFNWTVVPRSTDPVAFSAGFRVPNDQTDNACTALITGPPAFASADRTSAPPPSAGVAAVGRQSSEVHRDTLVERLRSRSALAGPNLRLL